MADDLFKGNIPKIDLSYATNCVSKIQAEMEERNRQMERIGEEAYKNRQRMQNAMEETAKNTAKTNMQLEKVVDNQNEYIDILKEQLSTTKQQLKIAKEQLDTLDNIFASGEDGVIVEKEIMKLIQEQIDSSHPLWEYVKDKGGDMAVGVITPVIYGAIKAYLLSKGIILP